MKTAGLDKTSFFLYLVIVGFGIANVYSVDSESGVKQAIWFAISLFAGVAIFIVRSKFFENLAGIFYIIAIILLIGIFPFGKEINGQKNWYVFGPISLQPVEFVKLAIALMLANYAASGDFDLKNKRSLRMSLLILAVPGLMVLLQPDVGSLMVFMAFLIALYREGLSGWIFVIGFALVAIFLFSIAFNPIYTVATILLIFILYILNNYRNLNWRPFNIIGYILLLGALAGLSFGSPKVIEKLPKHQRERIEVLFKGEKAFRDTAGYNLLYSKTAIGSGGFVGKGFKEGSVTQGKFVPEQRTDYIFCTVGEEWGFLGSAALVILYALYIGRIYYLSETQKTTFNRVFGYSFASILLMHFTINIGMVMGLFPTVGIPLPYFSYGGSSLLAFSIMTFIFFKLNYTDKNSLV